MNWRREWSILHMVDKLLVFLPGQCWAVYSGEATVRKIAVCARASRALVESLPVGIGMAFTAARIWLCKLEDICPPRSNRFTRASSASGLLARAVSVASAM